MKGLIFDIETNGLMVEKDGTPPLTKVHCIAIKDTESDEVRSFGGATDEKVRGILSHLEDAPTLIGHNIMKHDIPALQKVYPGFMPKGKIIDTLVCSRLMWPEIAENDFNFRRRDNNVLPGKLIGSHALEAWGYRLGIRKGDYGKGELDDEAVNVWAEWSQEMEDYCRQDIVVTAKLYGKILEKRWDERSIELEHLFQRCIMMQEAQGFPFNEAEAVKMYAEVAARRSQLGKQLAELFPAVERTRKFTPKVNNKKFGYTKGVEVTKRWTEEFNPGSGDDIAEWLIRQRQWVPEKFTDSGKPAVDDDVLEVLEKVKDWPEVKVLREWQVHKKIIGMLAEGKYGWLKLVKNGRIYGRVNTNGAVTGRCAHSCPNLGQVPKEGELGERCRSLFVAQEGYSLVGADASGLELRALSHYLARYDGGAYIIVVTTGDVHSANQKAAGLPTRGNAKTFIYAFLYGAGDNKIGLIVKLSPEEVDELLKLKPRVARALRRLEKDGNKNPSKESIATIVKGGLLKDTFKKMTPGLADLIEAVQTAVKEKGFLVGLDGRRLNIRSSHSALNTLLQSAGAVLVKQATVIFHQRLAEKGYLGKAGELFTKNLFYLEHIHDWNVCMVAHVHDEMQLLVKNGMEKEVGDLAVESIRAAGEHFKFRCPLSGEHKSGKTWAETH